MIGAKGFFFGYFIIGVSEEERSAVLDRLFAEGIRVRVLESGGIAVAENERRRVQPLLCGTTVSLSETKGLPGIIYRNRKRYGVFAAFAFCLFLFLFSCGRIWDIQLEGVDQEDAQAVLTMLSEEGVKPGVAFRSLDFSAIENALRQKNGQVAWINIHRRGTLLVVNTVSDRGDEENAVIPPGNLVASESCIVTAVSPKRGLPVVKVGDTVRRGELLVSAVQADGTLSGAAGEVLGLVRGEICVFVPTHEEQTVKKRGRLARVSIDFFDFSINIFKNYRNMQNDCDIIRVDRRLSLSGRLQLPIYLHLSYFEESHRLDIERTEAEAVQLAAVRLRSSFSEILRDGSIEGMKTVGEWKDGGYEMKAYYEQIKNIAVLVPITVSEN